MGNSVRGTAKALGLGEFALHRHWHRHVSERLKAAKRISILSPGKSLDDLINDESTDVLETLRKIRGTLLWSLDQLMQGPIIDKQRGVVATVDSSALAVLSAQLHKNLALVAQLTGELVHRSEHRSVSIVLNEEYLELRSRMIRALAQFPVDVRRAVADVFHQIEGTAKSATPVIGHQAAEATNAPL